MKVINVLIKVSLIVSLLISFSFSNVHQGRKIYVKNLKKICLMTSLVFAASHSQDEWEEIYDAGEFVNEVKKICPNITSEYNSEWTDNLYNFTYQYANDSENIPSC